MVKGNDKSSITDFEPKWFLPETWWSIIVTAQGRTKYMIFVALVIENIRSKDGSIEDASTLFDLLNTCGHFDFLGPAVNQLPELNQV